MDEGAESEKRGANFTEPEEVKTSILDMVKKDQEMRKNFAEGKGEMNPALDQENAQALKRIVETVGWPAKSVFGEEVASAAWLLVQHADFDLAFQEECLKAMKALPENEVKQEEVAYLEDRVKVAKGEPQLYGTQGLPDADNKFKPFPIEDPAKLEERRKQMGMVPFSDYQEAMDKMYTNFKAAHKE